MFTTEGESPTLNPKTINAIENLAINIAAQNNGRLFICQLMTYFPFSLTQINDVINQMVDNSSILKLEENGINYYQFKNLQKTELPPMKKSVWTTQVEGELRQIKLEHQIVHSASQIEGRIHPAAIAANTDFTLQDIKQSLEQMNLNGFISEKLDEENGSIYYIFPKTEYVDRNFKIIMNALVPKGSQESFDLTMGVFMKYMFTCIILIVLLLVAKVNYRFLVILFLLSMPFSAMMTYLKSKQIQG